MTANEIEEPNFQNWAKLAYIVINIGTQLLRDRLIELIKNETNAQNKQKFKTLQSFLEYYKKKINKFQKHKRDRLIDSQTNEFTNSPDQFDIQICYDLFFYLNIPESFKNHLRSIYQIRCDHFAHVSNTFLETSEMVRYSEEANSKNDRLLARIEKSLYNLAKDDEHRKKLKQQINVALRNRVEVCDLKLIFASIIASNEQNFKRYYEEFQRIGEQTHLTIKSLKDLTENSYNNLEQEIKSILDSFEEKNIRLVEFMQSMKPFEENIAENTRATHRVADEVQALKEKIDEMSKGNNPNKTYKDMEINELKEYFDEEFESNFFKILILDARNCHKTVNKDELANAIALTKWNMIVDLEKESNTSLSGKIFALQTTNYAKVRISQVSEMNQIEEKEIFADRKPFYLVNESDDSSFDGFFKALTNLENIFERNLKQHNNFSSRICFNLILNSKEDEENMENLKEINEEIYRLFNKTSLRDNEFLSIHLLLSDVCPIPEEDDERLTNLKQIIFKKTPKRFTNYELCLLKCKLSDIEDLKVCEKASNSKEFKIQGKTGEKTWTREDDKNYFSYFDVYHKTIGTTSLPTRDDDGDFEGKKKSFLIGNEIDCELMYFQENGFSCYVNTEYMEKTYQYIKKRVTSKVFYKTNDKPFVKIIHGPATGASTIGKVLLYKLRSDCPCIKLKNMDIGMNSRCVEGIQLIEELCELPIVILIDNDSKFGNESFDSDDVKELSDTFSRELNIRTYIIFIQRSTEFTSIPELSDTDIQCYLKLYEKYLNPPKPRNKNNKSILRQVSVLDEVYHDFMTIRWLYMKTHLTKSKEYLVKISEKARDYVNLIKKDADKRLFTLVIFVYMTDKFANGICLHIKIISLILNKKPVDIIKEFRTSDNKLLHLFKIEKNNSQNGYKFINFEFGEEIILNYFNRCRETLKEKILKEFFESFLKYLEIADIDTITQFSELAEQLLLKKIDQIDKPTTRTNDNIKTEDEAEKSDSDLEDNEKDIDSENEYTIRHYSDLVMEMKTYLRHPDVKIYLKKIWNIFTKNKMPLSPYLGVLYSKFTYYHDNVDEGLETIKCADILNITTNLNDINYKCPDQSRSSEIFTSYGYLMKNYLVYHIMKKFVDKHTDPNTNKVQINIEYNKQNSLSINTIDLNKVFEATNECVNAFRRAIKLDSDNAAAYIGDCMVRKELLSYVLIEYCKNDKEKYTQLIENKRTHDLITSSEAEIYFNMKKIDFISRYKDIKQNFSRFYIQNYVVILNFRNNASSTTNIDNVELFKLPIDFYILMKYKRKAKYWTDFTIPELTRIIDYNKNKIENDTFANFIYRNLILASIHRAIKLSKQKGNSDKSDSDLRNIIATCELWIRNMEISAKKKESTIDPDAYYYFFMLKLLHGIQLKDGKEKNDCFKKAIEFKKEYKNIFNKNNELASKAKTTYPSIPKNFKVFEFQIGKLKGLAGLVVFDEKNGSNELLEFPPGEFEEDKFGNLYINFNDIRIFLSPRKNSNYPEIKRAELGLRKKYKYFVTISRSNLFLSKYREA